MKLLTLVRFLIITTVLSTLFLVIDSAETEASTMNNGWCHPISTNYSNDKDNCLEESWKKVPEEIKTRLGTDSTQGFRKFKEITEGCVTSPFIGTRASEGACANATVYCFTRSMNAQECLRESTLSRIAIGCNDGMDTDEHGCDPIKDINKTIVDEIESAVQASFLNYCTKNSGETDSQTLQRCQDDFESARDECAQSQLGFESAAIQGGDERDAEYRLANQADYTKCLKEQLINRAVTEDECTNRGGKWNGSTNKCDPPIALSNPECEGQGGYNPVTKTCNDGTIPKEFLPIGTLPFGKPSLKCGKVETNLLKCNETDSLKIAIEILKTGIVALNAIIGIAAVGSIAWASVKYAKAEDNENEVKEAKELIRNVIIGLILYGFMVAIVNSLIPGGVIGS